MNMKKIIILFTVALVFSSCKKDVVQNNAVADNTSATIDYSAIKKTSGKAGSMLVFESWEHFNEVKNALVSLCVIHTNNYISPLAKQGLEDDDLTAQIEKDGFNAFQPVLDFGKKLSFESFYKLAEEKEKIWMNQNVEQLDPASDPFVNVERYESALLNNNGDVMIGSVVFNLSNVSFGKNTSCDQNGNNSRTVWYPYTSSIGKRQREMKGNIGPRPLQSISSTTMKYRKLSGGWAYWFTSPFATVEGNTILGTYEYGCNETEHPVKYTQSSLPWGFYVYNYSWHGKSPSWNIKYANQIKSKHAAPGYTLGHGY